MIKTKQKFNMWVAILLILLFVMIIFSITLGSAKINFIDSFKIVLSKIPLINNLVNMENIPATSTKIVIDIRLARILIAGLVGMGLAVCGAVYQGTLKNSMADPYILGVSGGAALRSYNSNSNRRAY